jgi:Spy/CpxP family protein refolding chaperone
MLLATVAAAATLACSSETSTSSNTGLTSDADAAVLASFGAGAWVGGVGADGIGGFGHIGWRLNELPDSLALTADQQTRITALVDPFKTANKTDLDSLAAIRTRAEAARNAGTSRDSVHVILATGDAIRARLRTAEQVLITQIEAVLTDAQRAFLSAQTCSACDSTVAPLTDEQKTSIDSLVAAFETANAADLAAVRAAREVERAARQAGVSQDSLAAIRASVQPALDRLRAARTALQAQINTLLTPEQIASGCYLQRGAPDGGGGRHGGRHGGREGMRRDSTAGRDSTVG